ncbi:peptidoglycan/xylan/chitin deacetylase (PgdA/CDA1 family)/predicted aspartyl protease [Pseudoxanthomonas japonensis]|uniref:aspartyl protease family protein n=1 Tax=Pseudoxanthomonas japonensis TaxID=69284 RepID=UPI002854F8ED|nr:aspartyl protease family protein [Pseudoxanthomonas japonensis]MDR7070064.1 peptidoglycan/xylan/chitin deacetylase (PgdA/CDA1 family)/predicted aspartyl protease [Pseudoxanthomonas japonensis]
MSLRLAVVPFALLLPVIATAQERCLPIEYGDGGSPVIKAQVKGEGPFEMVLDTAASGTTLDEKTVVQLGLVRDSKTEKAQGLGGAFSVRLFHAPSISAGPVSLAEAIVPEVPAPEFDSHTIVGLAGIDLLGEHLTIWRPGLGCVGISPSGGRPEGDGWVQVEVDWMQAWKILVPVRIGMVEGLALLDTGAQKTVLNDHFAKALGLTPKSGRLRAGGEIAGLDGRPLSLSLTDVEDVAIGPWQWPKTEVNVGDLPVFSRLGSLDRPIMVLGMDWLARRPFAVDYGAKKVWLRSTPTTPRTVALTFDDLPYAGAIGETAGALSVEQVAQLNARVLQTLQQHGAPAAGFVVEKTAERLGAEARSVLASWTQGQFVLANHSYSHADTNNLNLSGIEKEIVLGEATIRPLMKAAGKRLQFMRFPLNHTGDTPEKRDGILEILERLGYESAASTIDTSDYVFERAYRAALRRQDERCAARIRAAYLTHSATQIDYYAALNEGVIGRAPPEIALLHLNLINADTLDDLLKLYADRGYSFVSLEKAQQDPIYGAASTATYASPHGPMWAYRWARERRIQVNGAREAEPPKWLADYSPEEGGNCGAG